MIGDVGNEATKETHLELIPPPRCPPWLDQLSMALAASRPDVSRWPKGEELEVTSHGRLPRRRLLRG